MLNENFQLEGDLVSRRKKWLNVVILEEPHDVLEQRMGVKGTETHAQSSYCPTVLNKMTMI